jgi:hypothetical protein
MEARRAGDSLSMPSPRSKTKTKYEYAPLREWLVLVGRAITADLVADSPDGPD